MGRDPRWRLFRQEGGPDDGLHPLAYVALFTFCIGLGMWSVERYGSVLLWPANGVLLAALLQLHKRKALMALGACLAINLITNVLRGDAAYMVVLNAALNFGEVALAALLARRFCGATLDLRRPTRLARFAFFVVAPAVALSALIGVTAQPALHSTYLLSLQYWFGIETLGFLVTTPALLLLARRARFADAQSGPPWEKAALMSALVLTTVLVFAQSAAPVLFLVFLPLLAIAYRLPPHWSALAVMVVAVIGGAFSLNGSGPTTLGHMAPENWPVPEVVGVLNVLPTFQMFIAAVLTVSFGVSTIFSERRRLEIQLTRRTEAALAARANAEAAERRVTHMALHDGETGLSNRLALERDVAAMLEARGGRGVFVAAVGLDRFAAIRTAIGPALAAALLEETARRLAGRLRQASVGRLSTSSLGIALRAASLDEAATRLSEAREAFADAVALGESRVDVRLTIGLAGAPEHASDERALIERAQIALDQAYSAKSDLAVFDAAAERTAASSLSLISELREGMRSGALWLAHQPKLDLRSGTVTGVESLIRWSHPVKGPIPPDAFIPLAEETGFVGPLTDWVLDRALADQAELARAGQAVGIAVNVSARSLCDAGFAQRLAAIVAARQADPHRITLEITETAVMANPEIALATLAALKGVGFRIAVDDFGAGMSSLAYLKRIPADELKIDQSFIRTLAENSDDAVLVRSTIDLGHALGLKVVAEGVEDQATLDLLALFGCDMAQGYLIARPLPVSQLAPVIANPPVRAFATAAPPRLHAL